MSDRENAPPEKEVGPRGSIPEGNDTFTGHHQAARNTDSIGIGQRHVSSRAVSWLSVHDFVTAVLDQVNDWPTLGTPAWCSLTRDDPRKWAALLDGSQHWALRLETCQEQMAQASRDVSAAADWAGIARGNLRHTSAVRSGAYIPRAGVS